MNDNRNFVLWETEFFAISMLSGQLEKYRGLYIKAKEFTEAMKWMRAFNLTHLQLTGRYFNNFDEVVRSNMSKEGEMDIYKMDISKMAFDDFMDMLDNAETIEDLIDIKEMVVRDEAPEAYINIINNRIDEYENEEEDET